MNRPLAILLTFTLALAACASDDADDQAAIENEPTSTTDAATTSTTSTTSTTAPAAEELEVDEHNIDTAAGGTLHFEQGAISALFGLDNTLPPRSVALCPQAPGLDGMPVVLGSEIDQTTLDVDDFKVQRASGELGTVACVTLRPAIDLGELRTVLLIGEFGSPDDPPVTVSIVGELLALDGSRDLIGSTVDVVALPDGPSLVLASVLTAEERAASTMTESNDSCVGDPDNTVLRVVWDGGVSLPSGEDITEADLDIYEVTIVDGVGRASSVAPVGFADVNDSDNNHELCLATTSTPIEVSAAPGRLVDPRGDLNPTTAVDVSP